MSTATLETPKAPASPQAAPTPGRRRLKVDRGRVGWMVFVVVLGVLVLAPIVPLQWQALADGADGYARLGDVSGLGEVFTTTLMLGFGATALGLILGTALALAMNALPARWQSILGFMPVLPMVMPSVAHVVGFVFLFSPDNGYVNTFLRSLPFFDGETGPVNVYSVPWIIIYTGTHLAAFVYLFVRTGLTNLGADYGLAARVNGAGGLRVLLTVTLPLLRPTFVYAGGVVFLLSLGQFTGPLVLGGRENVDVLATKLYEYMGDYPVDYPLAAAVGSPLLLVAVVMVLIQRRMVGSAKRFVGQGASSRGVETVSKTTTAVSATIVIGYVLIAAILPLLALVYVSVSPYWSGTIDFGAVTLQHFSDTLSQVAVYNAIVTTLVVSIVGVVLSIALGMVIAHGIHHKDRLAYPIPQVLDFLANLPLSVPAALMGFGFLFVVAQPGIGLYGTKASLIIAYVVIMIPYAVRYHLATLASLGSQSTEASLVAGAGALRTFFLVTVPLSRAGIASSAAMIFVLLSHEFGVSLLLKGPGSNVLSVVLYQQYSTGAYPAVAVIALIMTVVTAIGLLVALKIGGKRALENM